MIDLRPTVTLFALAAVACGRPHDGNTNTTSDGAIADSGGGVIVGDGASTGRDSGSVTADGPSTGRDGGTQDGAGGAGDGGIMRGCAAATAPAQATTVTTATLSMFMFSTPTGVYARLGDSAVWLHWAGVTWSQETIPWPSGVSAQPSVTIDATEQLANGSALLAAHDLDGSFVTTFDGTTIAPVLRLPMMVDTPWAYAEGPDGAYHVFVAQTEIVSKPDGTWYPPAPIPVPPSTERGFAAATVMANGRVIVAFDDHETPQHLHVISHAAGGAWTADQDITPQWAIDADEPFVYAPAGGGIAVANGENGDVWRSADGTTFGDYETLGAPLTSMSGPCLDSLVATGDIGRGIDLFAFAGGVWTPIDEYDAEYLVTSASVMQSDGKTFWAAAANPSGTEYRASE